MNNLIDLDSLDGLDFEDGFDIVKDNSFENQFDTFFNFLPTIKDFVVEMDMTNAKIEYWVKRQKDLILDFNHPENHKTLIQNINKFLDKPISNFQEFGYKKIYFDSVEYSEILKTFYVQIGREVLYQHYEDSDMCIEYYKSDILSYLNNRKKYIDLKIYTEILDLISPILKERLNYLKNIKREYEAGRTYMYDKFFLDSETNDGVGYLEKVENVYNIIREKHRELENVEL